MPLNKVQLKDGIHQAFKKMQDTPPPKSSDKAVIEQHFAQLLIDLAKDLANSIETYVQGGDVVGVNTSGSVLLNGDPQTVTINTNQTNVGKMQ